MESLAKAIRQEKGNKRHADWKGKSKAISIHRWYHTAYGKS